MTRSVTLADLMPARVGPTPKPGAVTAATEDGVAPDGGNCFAQALEDAGSAGTRTDEETGTDARDGDAGPSADPLSSATGRPSGETALKADGSSLCALVSTRLPLGLTAGVLPRDVGVARSDASAQNCVASRDGVTPHKTVSVREVQAPQQAPHPAPAPPLPQTPSPGQSAPLPLAQIAPAPSTTTPAAPGAGPVTRAAGPLASPAGVGTTWSPATFSTTARTGDSSAGVGTTWSPSTVSTTAHTGDSGAERTAPPEPAQVNSADVQLAPFSPDTKVRRPVTPVALTSLPASLHAEAGGQPRDFEDSTKAGTGQAPSRAQGAETVGPQALVPGPMSNAALTSSGEFTVHLAQGDAESPRSQFVVSNDVLTATISRPFNEGNGTYSVTAMLNPPSLGHVQAVVKVDGTNVNVAIVAHTPEGHRAIATHLDELRSELGAHGGDVQLSLSDGGNKGSRRDGSDPAPATAQESEEAEALVLTVAPAQGAKSLHVIL
ncbi:MAG: flagellar hook-length control protein FliK [Acidimicrobiales bacterium]